MKKISILAYPGCMGAEIFGLSDTLTVANRVATTLSGRALMERRTGIFSSKVKRWLLQRLALPYRLEELANAFHVSTRTLHRRFKAKQICRRWPMSARPVSRRPRRC